ncbi:MAG: DinB family protein [Silvibacterium sp.]|nr:DinB family protein [Silvibacterium sp.]
MNELQRNLIGNGFGAPPSHVLEAVDDAMAHRRYPGAPHSIYEEVWHLAFWQQLTLDWIAGKPTKYPEHASEGFPASTDEPWDTVRERFLQRAKKLAEIAGDEAQLGASVVSQSRTPEPARTRSLREQIEGEATHNAYHLGRVVLLRQVFGAWPPPSGGDTW